MWATDKIQILQKLSACVQNRSKDFAILVQSTFQWLLVLHISFGLTAWFRLTRLQSVPMNTYLNKCLNCDYISEPPWHKSWSCNLPPSCRGRLSWWSLFSWMHIQSTHWAPQRTGCLSTATWDEKKAIKLQGVRQKVISTLPRIETTGRNGDRKAKHTEKEAAKLSVGQKVNSSTENSLQQLGINEEGP